MKPKLQLALDLTDLDKALKIAENVNDSIDILEVGTILAIESGMDSIREIRKLLPDIKILGDVRIIKAGGKIASMVYEAGADIVTIISDSTDETFEAVVKEKNKCENREVLIEINDSYTEEHLNKWKQYGLTHLIFHRGSEITSTNEKWNEKDFSEIRKLHEKGFKVYVTGGIGIDEISCFEGVPVESFIIGRTISQASNPLEVAQEIQKEISKYF